MSYLEEPQQPKKSKGLSIFLWVFGILGLLVVLACGGILLTSYLFFKRVASQDPAKVRALAREITEIEVPAGFEPTMSFNFQGMRMVMFAKGEPPGSSGMLMLMESPSGPAQEDDQALDEMQRSLRSQPPQIKHIDESKTEEKTFTIRGEEQTVTIQHGTGEEGKAWAQVTAPFTSKQGKHATLMYLVPESEWDEGKLEALLESMK